MWNRPTKATDKQKTIDCICSYVHAAIEDKCLWGNLGGSGLDSSSTYHLAGPEEPESLQSMRCQPWVLDCCPVRSR